MRNRGNALVLLVAALCVAGFVLVGAAAVVVVVTGAVAALTWQVAAASLPRPPHARDRGARGPGRGASGGPL